MAKKTAYKVKGRRRREKRTDYAKRLKLLKSEKNRLVARILNKTVVAQIIKYNPGGDETLVNTTSLELKKYGWKTGNRNVCTAYLTGLLCGKKAVKRGIREAVLDIGLHTPTKWSNVFAVLRGAVEAGLSIKHDKSILPPDERVLGREIEKFRNIKLNVEEVRKKILEEKE